MTTEPRTYTKTLRRFPGDYQITVRLKVSREFKFRAMVAKLLILAAGWVLGSGINVEEP